jgi:uncharacterized protein (TIGR02118 family)
MPRSLLTASFAALAFVAGCSKPATPPPAATPPPPPPPGVGWSVVVMYNQPKDTAAFEKYYAETHIPLFVAHAQEIGVTRVDLVRFAPGADGKKASVYREADLRWDSKEARDRGMATAGFQAVAGDLPKFASGGFTVLLGQKTN